MSDVKEIIQVEHNTGNGKETDVDFKGIRFEYNGYAVDIDIAGDVNYFKGVWISIRHDDFDDGIKIRLEQMDEQLKLSIDNDGGLMETNHRSYKEWLKLERLESAIKLIGGVIK